MKRRSQEDLTRIAPWPLGAPGPLLHQLGEHRFVLLCYELLRAMNPGDDVQYREGAGDLGCDLLHVRTNGKVTVGQCACFAAHTPLRKVRADLAKIVTGVLTGALEVVPDEIVFYCASEPSAAAARFVASDREWDRLIAAARASGLDRKALRSWRPRRRFELPADLAQHLDRVPHVCDRYVALRFATGGDTTIAPRPRELFDFSLERSRHAVVLEREDVFDEIARLLKRQRSIVLLQGSMGVGKSAILHEYLARRERAHEVVPYHFIRRGTETSRPGAIVRSLAAQLEALHPDLRDRNADSSTRLDEFLSRLVRSGRLDRAAPLILAIDGLDEAIADPESANPLPEFLPATLPEGVSLLCSSRPNYPHLSWLEQRDSFDCIDLDQPRWVGSNRRVVTAFWRRHRGEFDSRLVNEAIAAAGGNILHAAKLHEWLITVPKTQRQSATLPRGLRAFLDVAWSGIAVLGERSNTILSSLALLAVARDPLTLGDIAACVDGTPAWIDAFLRHTRAFLISTPEYSGSEAGWRVFHECFREFIESHLGSSAMREAHGILSARLANRQVLFDQREPDHRQQYAARHLFAHARAAGRVDTVVSDCLDFRALRRCAEEIGVDSLLDDLRAATTQLGKTPIEVQAADVMIAIDRHAHWLREYPSALPALLHRELLCRGWKNTVLSQSTAGEHFILRLRTPLQHVTNEVRNFRGHDEFALACCFATDSRQFFSAGDTEIKQWDLDTGQCVRTLSGHTDTIFALAIATDRTWLLSASRDRTLRRWDTTTGECSLTLRPRRIPFSCGISGDGRWIVSGHRDGGVKVWSAVRGTLTKTLSRTQDIGACAISEDGRTVLTVASGGTIDLWDVGRGDRRRVAAGGDDDDGTCALSRSGDWCVASTDSQTVAVVDMATAKIRRRLRYSAEIARCLITPDDRSIVVGTRDGYLEQRDRVSGQSQWRFKAHSGSVSAAAFSPDGRWIVSGGIDGTLRLWNTETVRTTRQSSGHKAWVRSCALSSDGRIAASIDDDLKIFIWSTATGRCTRVIDDWPNTGIRTQPAGLVLTSDGTRVVAAHMACLRIWDAGTGRRVDECRGLANSVEAFTLDSSQRTVLFVDDSGVLHSWRIGIGTAVAELRVLGANRHDGLAVTPDWRLAAVAADNCIVICDRKGNQRLVRGKHRSYVTCCRFIHRGTILVSGSVDGTLKLWDPSTGKCMATIPAHSTTVFDCAPIQDGRFLLSASYDHTLQLIDTSSGSSVAHVLGDAHFSCVAVGPGMAIAGDAAGNLWFLSLDLSPLAS